MYSLFISVVKKTPEALKSAPPLRALRQHHFAHHGETLYEELKHVRNHLCGVEALLRQQTNRSPDDVAAPIAQAHAVLAVQTRRKKQPHAKQLKLL